MLQEKKNACCTFRDCYYCVIYQGLKRLFLSFSLSRAEKRSRSNPASTHFSRRNESMIVMAQTNINNSEAY